jgi:hypothetical protein
MWHLVDLPFVLWLQLPSSADRPLVTMTNQHHRLVQGPPHMTHDPWMG